MSEFTIKHREELLPRLDTSAELAQAREGWIELREERVEPIIIPRYVGKRTVDLFDLRTYQRDRFRIPPLTLSKYSNVEILREQLLVAQPGVVSADTFEEYVVEEDRHWFDADDSFDHDGKRVTIPRLRYQKFARGPNRVTAGDLDTLQLVEVEGPVVSTLSWWGGINLSHWMVDCLPRLWALPFIHEPDLRVLVPNSKAPFVAEALALMGFGNDRIVRVGNGGRYKIDTLYVPSRVGSHYNYFSPEIVNFYRHLRDRVQGFERGTDALIYISRKDSDKRRCLEEAELEAGLEKRGFRIVVMSELSFAERVELMAGCRFVVSECGAGLTTSLMMPDKSIVFATGTPEMIRNASLFTNIATQKKQDVFLFTGKPVDEGRQDLVDWSIDVEDCLRNVDRVLATV